MWKLVTRIGEDASTDALDLAGAQIAEIAYTPAGWKHESLRMIVRRTRYTAAQISANPRARRRKTIHPQQLALLLDGQASESTATASSSPTSTTKRPSRSSTFIATAPNRGTPQRRKLSQALRRTLQHHNANRTWMAACLLALTTALVCDLCPAAGASGKAPADAPLRRTARHCAAAVRVPARVSTSARQTILHLPASYRHATVLSDTYHAALSLPET